MISSFEQHNHQCCNEIEMATGTLTQYKNLFFIRNGDLLNQVYRSVVKNPSLWINALIKTRKRQHFTAISYEIALRCIDECIITKMTDNDSGSVCRGESCGCRVEWISPGLYVLPLSPSVRLHSCRSPVSTLLNYPWGLSQADGTLLYATHSELGYGLNEDMYSLTPSSMNQSWCLRKSPLPGMKKHCLLGRLGSSVVRLLPSKISSLAEWSALLFHSYSVAPLYCSFVTVRKKIQLVWDYF